MTAIRTAAPHIAADPRPHRLRAGVALRGWVTLLRPWFWPVSLLPLIAGSVLATGRLVPLPADRWTMAITMLVVGPLAWGAVLLDNDLNDLPNDRHNLRRITSPLVSGTVDPTTVRLVQVLLSVAAVGAALLVAPLLALGTCGVLLLGWAYSARPVRLKSLPVADVAVNALAIGVLGPLAGWQLHRPILDYPPALVGLGLALGAALYLPTTVIDLAADRAAGDRTFAVRYGRRRTHHIGLTLWIMATTGWLLWGSAAGWLEGYQVVVQAVWGLVLAIGYGVLTRRPSIARLAVISVGFCGSAGWFLLANGVDAAARGW